VFNPSAPLPDGTFAVLSETWAVGGVTGPLTVVGPQTIALFDGTNENPYGFQITSNVSVLWVEFAGSSNASFSAAAPTPTIFQSPSFTEAYTETTFTNGSTLAFRAYGLNATGSITGVPELPTWAMALIGFALTGLALRRRERAALC
jgi:hypothetical protein